MLRYLRPLITLAAAATIIFAICTTVYFLAVLAIHWLSPRLAPVAVENGALPA